MPRNDTGVNRLALLPIVAAALFVLALPAAGGAQSAAYSAAADAIAHAPARLRAVRALGPIDASRIRLVQVGSIPNGTLLPSGNVDFSQELTTIRVVLDRRRRRYTTLSDYLVAKGLSGTVIRAVTATPGGSVLVYF